jgi:hypothetical protein
MLPNTKAFITGAILANVQEIAVRVLAQHGGNAIASVDPDTLVHDVAACIQRETKLTDSLE